MSEWKTIPADEYCDSVRDGTHDTPKPTQSGFKLVTGKHLKKGVIDPSDAYFISESDYNKINERSKVDQWDVLMSMIGTIGEIAVVKDKPNYAIKNIALFKCGGSELKGKWLAYYLSSPIAKGYFSGNQKGSSQQFLSLNQLRNLPILVADESYMKYVVEILSRYDSLIENYQKQIKLLEEAAQRLYKEWFVELRFPGHENTKMVDGLPEGWERKKISEICDTIGGGTPSTKIASYYEGGTINWVTPTDITKNNSLCLLSTEKKITTEGLNHSSAKMLPAETILMTSRASVGYFGICDFEVCTNQGFISCVPFDWDCQMYLLYNLMNRVEEIRIKAGGSTYLEISKSVFRNFEIVIPTKFLLARFQQEAHRILERMRNTTNQIRLLTEARDRLLPRLMGGEMEVDAPKGQRTINPAHRSGYNPQTNHAPKGQKN